MTSDQDFKLWAVFILTILILFASFKQCWDISDLKEDLAVTKESLTTYIRANADNFNEDIKFYTKLYCRD